MFGRCIKEVTYHLLSASTTKNITQGVCVLNLIIKMVLNHTHQVSLWDKDAASSLLSGIRVAPGSAEYEDLGKQFTSSPTKDYCAIGLPMFTPRQPNTEMQCSHCKVTFTTRQEQVEHYKLDWHRCNLKRAIGGKNALTEDQFLNDISDVSSISGSEDDNSEDEDDSEKTTQDEEQNNPVLRRQARMFFVNADGLVISLYRSVLFSKKCQMDGEQDAVQRVQALPQKQMWAVILLGGGHFAAAIFNGSNVVIHKTFHNYTVRAKQGGSQSSRDNHSGTSHPKSSGASLRRYNELSQRQHIQELMESWKGDLAKCNLIFYHAKNQNRNTLFGGKNAILNSPDSRLRTVPFPTKRAKFSEVKRVYGLLSEVHVHGNEEEFQSMIKECADKDIKPSVKKQTSSPSKRPERKLKSERRDVLAFSLSSSESSDEDSDNEIVLMTTAMTFSTRDLGGAEGECSVNVEKTRRRVERKRTKKPANTKSSGRRGNHHKSQLYDVLYTACRTGKLDHLALVLKKPLPENVQEDTLSDDIMMLIESEDLPENISTITFSSKGKTMLHIAAENNQKDVIWWLLYHGCDPSVADYEGLVPFFSSKNKSTRNHFRKFMAQYPDRYDYKKACIPSPLTPEQEAEQAAKEADKKKAKRQANKEKQKQKRQEEKEKKKEEEEKKRYLELSDREKRALAAERRLLKQQEETGAAIQVMQRCFFCATDITGMVPFEYSDFKFCSTKCVREHRTKKS